MKGIIHTHVCACEILGPNMRRVGNNMAVSVNSLANNMRAIKRIAKDAILHDFCPKSMGVSVKNLFFTRQI